MDVRGWQEEEYVYQKQRQRILDLVRENQSMKQQMQENLCEEMKNVKDGSRTANQLFAKAVFDCKILREENEKWQRLLIDRDYVISGQLLREKTEGYLLKIFTFMSTDFFKMLPFDIQKYILNKHLMSDKYYYPYTPWPNIFNDLVIDYIR